VSIELKDEIKKFKKIRKKSQEEEEEKKGIIQAHMNIGIF
jgi:hypothetical protein